MRFLLAAVALLFLAACGRGPEALSREAYIFGTRVEIKVWNEGGKYGGEATAEAAMAEALLEFDRLHRTYHAWKRSELTALNEAIDAGRPHEVTEEMAGLIREAQAVAAQGDHLFDPGIGRLVKLWGFHDDSFPPALPDAKMLAWARDAKPSIADLRVDGRRVTSRNRAVALDFGGYLKGVALDRAAAILRGKGVNNALINIGGNVLALGSKGGQPWRVGIQHPRSPSPLATLDLKDGEAVGTSGDYQRFFELDGRRYAHLIDPRTGAPAEGTQAVTVLILPGPQAGMWSDAASKPLFIAGPGWRPLAERMGIAHVLRIDAAGRVETTPALAQRLRFEDRGPALR